MYQLIADGIPWVDSDGNDTWDYWSVVSLAEVVESQGHEVEIVPV